MSRSGTTPKVSPVVNPHREAAAFMVVGEGVELPSRFHPMTKQPEVTFDAPPSIVSHFEVLDVTPTASLLDAYCRLNGSRRLNQEILDRVTRAVPQFQQLVNVRSCLRHPSLSSAFSCGRPFWTSVRISRLLKWNSCFVDVILSRCSMQRACRSSQWFN